MTLQEIRFQSISIDHLLFMKNKDLLKRFVRFIAPFTYSSGRYVHS